MEEKSVRTMPSICRGWGEIRESFTQKTTAEKSLEQLFTVDVDMNNAVFNFHSF
jgi:hypothetical protein